ncbi:MAG: 1-acyl-sn-glycerol-3-phosphate acyltransferase [Muribaculaceae bacterium]|nr:1-acyl-sn-glycerol-3-phosphate acyltransferase [Muribaculaceae bacterium]
MSEINREIIQIDVASVLRERAPRYYRWMPRFVVRWIERLICQDELNAMLRQVGDKRDVEAAQMVLDYLNITVRVEGLENVPEGGRYIFASNHPLGGLDGLALIATFGRLYDGGIRFLVNDLLMAVEPLRGVFLPVNKYGSQSRQAAMAIAREYAGPNQMLTFPAGLCSRQKSGKAPIEDLRWNKAVVTLAARSKRDVVPIYFDGHNSKWFYRWARWRERLGIKFNLEMLLLPREMIHSRGASFTIHVGKPVGHDTLDTRHAPAEAMRLRSLTYAMRPDKPEQ